jgi:hypothetical protein
MAQSNAFKFANNIISNGKFDANDLSVSVTGGPSLQAVKTSGFTAVANEAYPCDTTSAGFTVTLPATPSAGDQVQVVDYAGTFDSNALIIDPNGEDIEGGVSSLKLTGEREGVILTYIDSTQGWIATSGINEGTNALAPTSYTADFLVIAGGGGGGYSTGAGGGGAGGYRNSYSTEQSGGGGSSEASLTFNLGTVYTVTVGAGGVGSYVGGSAGTVGVNSSISGTGITTITSSGGGGGASNGALATTGGAGGGGSQISGYQTGASGTANQGYAGGTSTGTADESGSGGGGAGAVGVNGAGSGVGATGGTGGAGLASSITGSSVPRGGGGGGSTYQGTLGAGGSGGGGAGSKNIGNINRVSGSVNTGGGGGGGDQGGSPLGSGGSGVVILRMPTANYSSTTTGSPTVTTDGADTILVFNDSGSYTG